MAGASSSYTLPSEVRPPPPTKFKEVIASAASSLVTLGINESFFRYETYMTAGFTDGIYAGMLRPFADIDDLGRCEQLLQLGISQRFFGTFRGARMAQFTRFLQFLKSPTGQETFSRMAQRDRLARRGGDVLSAQEAGVVAGLEVQITDTANEVTDYRKSEEAEIANLELQIREIRARIDENVNKIKESKFPGGVYVPLTVPEMNKACWQSYLHEAALTGQSPAPINEKNLIDAVHTYSVLVRKRHMFEYASQDGYTDAIQAYIREKIGNFEAVRNVRAARRFRGLLEVMGADVTTTVSTGATVITDGADPSGKDQRQTAAEFYESVVPPPIGEPVIGEEADGEEAETEHRARHRTSTVQPGHDQKPPKDRSARREKKNRRKRDTTGEE
ncbi:hypothetical protein MA16_Dca016145 [Dendrobium catenatum]|uniref:Uncharacterized protein n=1 Tax=Dendrobium catenatum TaxID=906689 RepID=A0A2I0WI66_9ASPA|nr:hypothetical protein MA16_Dca016145 [Dendrobium catenatum]